jgi:hypothetical protein
MPWISAGIAVAGGASSYLGGRKANQANARHRDSALKQDRAQVGKFGALAPQLEALGRKRMGDVTTGYRRAGGAISRAQAVARSQILNDATTASGYATQSVISRGLNGGGQTPTADYAKRGVFYETARALTQSQGEFARQRATLEVARGNAIAGIRGDQMNLKYQNFLTDDQLVRAKLEHVLGVTAAASDTSVGFGGLSSYLQDLFASTPSAASFSDADMAPAASGYGDQSLEPWQIGGSF